MKTGIAALGALSLINLAAAQPNGHSHRRHQQLHDKREDVVYETEYTYVTAQLPKVIVYVDENNNPYSTSTEGQAAATSAISTSVAATSVAATSVAAVSSAPAPVISIDAKVKNVVNNAPPAAYSPVSSSATTLAPVYVASSSAQAYTTQAASTSSYAAASSKAPSSGAPSGDGYGMVYSPYHSDHTCKSQDEVNSDFAAINSWAQSNGESWNLVRSYGADCDQVAMMLSAGKQYGVKIFAGIWNVADAGAFAQEMDSFKKQVNGDWSMIHTVSIGNEVVNKGEMTVQQITDRVSQARPMFHDMGYFGPVVAVDTFIAMITNKDLCAISDYAAVNAHAFFDVNTPAELAGTWVLAQMKLVSATCGGKDTWITETGWPTQGNANGLAIPGFSQQKSALASIKKAVSSNLIMFTAFNDMWKENTGATFDAEQYWGICN